jgi:hypothetical protein
MEVKCYDMQMLQDPEGCWQIDGRPYGQNPKMLNSLEIVWNGILEAVRVVGGRTAFADQIGTARPFVRVLLGDE